MKLPKFESLTVSEVRNLDGKFFVFHINLAVQDALTISAESIISIGKVNLTNNSVKFLL